MGGVARELEGCSACVPEANWPFFLCGGGGGMQLMCFFVFVLWFRKNEVTMSLASCYRVEIYSGWAPDEGKCASKGRKKGPLEGRPDQEKDEV